MKPTLSHRKIKVLYLDDEENNLKSFKAAFRTDYEVYTALTSEEAFQIVKNARPPVIFSDQRMPFTTGVEFFSAVRQVFPEPVRILITGYTDIKDIIEAINKGHIYRYITKPWNEHEIRMAVDNAYDLFTTRRQLDKKVEELQKSNHELSSFIYRASHDLRGPLASSLGLIRVAKHEVKDETALDYLGKIEDTSMGLDSIVSNIVDFYKNSRQGETVENVEFEELVKEVLEGVEIHTRELKYRIKTSVEQSSTFIADSFRLRIILSHLITNAIKFKTPGQEEAEVEVRINANNEQAVMEVEDKGVGIRKDLHERIFQIFYKGNDAGAGSGIGLYIVREALEKMGGEVQVESKIGEGSLFLAKIPNQV